ncbi:hypothetical protein NDN08_008187 [Rhodosorus marinus]|uniref:CDP-diacylglycerol--inositol 3-phosphatidyltransferase n=1 Tax=Rhodosorus marinus TaxID=101924 RepID=A0AAV8V3K5_9RHOD|nr:hypothetical protein NDN08_008187 [Rhodosorus marinus]
MVRVFLYVPNLIGYARCLFMVLALIYWQDPTAFLLLYSASFGLDAWDGYFARLLKQTSELGAVLDMLTDRSGSAMMLMILAQLYKSFAPVFLALMYLDCFSHWVQMSSGLCSGTTSHKHAGNQSSIIRFYYTRPALTFTCLFNELFFIMLYLLHFKEGTVLVISGLSVNLLKLFTWGFCFVVFLAKQLVNINQIVTAHTTLLSSPSSS